MFCIRCTDSLVLLNVGRLGGVDNAAQDAILPYNAAGSREVPRWRAESPPQAEGLPHK
jgi:hypothetical protein